MDNHSTDGSLSIAKSFDNVTVISWKSDTGMIDEHKYIELKSQTYKQYSRSGGEHTTEIADWVISCDMDEILYHPDLINVLSRFQASGVTCPETIGMQMLGEHTLDPKAPIAGQYKVGFEETLYSKSVIFTPDFNIYYTEGCHPHEWAQAKLQSREGYKAGDEKLYMLHHKHIGNRAFERGVVCGVRLNPKTVQKNAEGEWTGPGFHYKVHGDVNGLNKIQNYMRNKNLVNIFDSKCNFIFNEKK